MTGTAGPALVLAALLLPAAGAAAAPRTAVLIGAVTRPDAELAANVTDVVVARVVQHGQAVVASDQLRAALGLGSEQEVQRCAEVTACLGRAALSLGVSRVLAGDVHADPIDKHRYRFQLALHDLTSGSVSQRIMQTVDGPLENLVTAVQDATDTLFRPRRAPGRLLVHSIPGSARVMLDNVLVGMTPMQIAGVSPGWHRLKVEPAGRFAWAAPVLIPAHGDLSIRLTPEQLPSRRRWPTYLAVGSGGTAALALVAGGFLGVASEMDARLPDREEAMRDFQRRARMGQVATGLLVGGCALAVLSVYSFFRYQDHIFGRDPAD